MVRRIVAYIILIVSIVACGNFKAPNKPENLPSKEQMVHILIDARLVGSATSVNRKVMESHGIDPDKYIFEKYDIDSLQFEQSNNYYAYYVKEYEDIYNRVIDSLEALKAHLDDLEKAEQKRKEDSINAIRVKDSLDIEREKDSLENIQLKGKVKDTLAEEEGVLINPVSETDPQP